MESPVASAMPKVSAETLALNSIAFGCNSANGGLNSLPEIMAAQQKAFLQESIFFHHFIAIAAVSYVIHDLNSRHAYCEKMVAAINSESRILRSVELGLPPQESFSAKDREDAIKDCFFNPPNIAAWLGQELYLGRRPSESESKVMELNTVREMTGWDSPSANAVQYFATALLARLVILLEIDFHGQFLDFMNLSAYTVAESRAAFETYIELLGARVVIESGDVRVRETPEAKRSWFSNLFKSAKRSRVACDEGVGSRASKSDQKTEWVEAHSEDRRAEPAPALPPLKVEPASTDIPIEMIEKGVYLRRNQFRGISDWEERMFSEFGEKVVPLLGRIWNSTS
jgi:hypothetical protein